MTLPAMGYARCGDEPDAKQRDRVDVIAGRGPPGNRRHISLDRASNDFHRGPRDAISNGMVTSGQLISEVASVSRLPPVTVGTYYKALREAGLTSKSGRGPSAARMTVTDAANLLIAIGSGASAKDAPAAVRRIRAYKRQRTEDTLRVAALDGRIPGDDFGTVFDHLLHLQVVGDLQPTLQAIPREKFARNRGLAGLNRKQGIRSSEKADRIAEAESSLSIEFNNDDEWVSLDINRDYAAREISVDGALFSPDEPDMEWTPGIVTTRTLLFWALNQVADALGGDNPSR